MELTLSTSCVTTFRTKTVSEFMTCHRFDSFHYFVNSSLLFRSFHASFRTDWSFSALVQSFRTLLLVRPIDFLRFLSMRHRGTYFSLHSCSLLLCPVLQLHSLVCFTVIHCLCPHFTFSELSSHSCLLWLTVILVFIRTLLHFLFTLLSLFQHCCSRMI